VSERLKMFYYPEVEGLGTTYEAYVTAKFLSEFVTEHKIATVCEYPVCTFRAPGAIGVQLAARGCELSLATTDDNTLQKAGDLCRKYNMQGRVRLVKIGEDRIDPESFDLVFHISLISTMRKDLGMHPFSCLQEMVRLSKRYVIVTNHNLHYSILLDRILSRITRTAPQFGQVSLVGGMPVKSMLRNLGLVICDEFLFDIPPWTAIDLSKLLPDIRMFSTRGIARSDDQTIERAMQRYSIIENSAIPNAFKRLLSHHIAIVAEKP